MADWLDITDTQVDPDAPLTSQLGYAWRDNPVAIAEGAAGAPRVQGVALGGISLGAADTSTTTSFIDCALVGTVVGSVAIVNAANGVFIRVAFSNDNGASYGAWKSFGAHVVSTLQYISGTIRFNLQTGVWQSATVSNKGAASLGGGTFSVPAGCNAFRLSLSTPASGVIDLLCLGGIE